MIPLTEIIDIAKNTNAERIALQFPEGLKRYSGEVSSALKKEGYDVIISGDPCWGSCCLALDALNQADILIHIGHTPVTEHENVYYVPFFQEIDVNVLEKAVPTLMKYDSVAVITTVQHAKQIHEMAEFLRGRGVNCTVGKGLPRTPYDGQILGCTYAAAKSPDAECCFFVGTGVFHAIGAALATKKPTYALDPFASGDIQEVSCDRLLRRRFAVIEKAKSAENFGILLSSKSGQMRKELAYHLASLHKCASVILIDEISEMQLRNLGFDAYVNTACPRLSMDDQTRFHAPVLSPQEFEILLGIRSWDDYEIDEIV